MPDQLRRWFKVAAAAALSKLPPVRCVSAPITHPISFLVVAPVSTTTSSMSAGASEVAGLVGAVATAAVAGAFALVAGAEEVSVFAAEVGVDEAGAVC